MSETGITEATKEETQGTKDESLCKKSTTDSKDEKKSPQEIFDKRFEEVNRWSIEPGSIFKVNMGLYESNPDAYRPKLISIGPYHRKDPQLGLMEVYKLRYLQRFLQRNRDLNVDSLIMELDKSKDKALESYDDKRELVFNSEFSEMLLLDGCFVIEYIREVFQIVPTGEDNIINADWMVSLIDRDLLLLENQLPFFILTRLYEMTMNPKDAKFIEMVKYNFCSSLPRVSPKLVSEPFSNVKDIKHLLQVVHMCGSPPTSGARPYILTIEVKRKAKDPNIWHDLMRSATELDEAGVNLSKLGDLHRMLDNESNKDWTCLFDIEFDKKTTMKIPCFEVVDGTETVIRNLVAYEQHTSIYPKPFSDYVVFMDRLIDSEKDVKLLREKGIIRNRIGDDDQVAKMFNRLAQGVIPSTNFYFKQVCRTVVEHCEKPWSKCRASLLHDYFNGPWVGLSTGAACLLLALAITQTILAVITLAKQK